MSKNVVRLLRVLLAVTLLGAACSSDETATAGGGSDGSTSGGEAEEIDYTAIGLWDDGPCDATKPKLVIGLMTVFESAVISLKDSATGLEASATAFNQRGGANGSCVEVHTCDDGANPDQAVACAQELDNEGVVATVNDLPTAGQADVAAAMTAANIPRVATNVTPADWSSQNLFPLDASGFGLTLMQPQALVDQGAKEIGLVRADLAQGSALTGLLDGIYTSQGASFPFEAPVPGGTTDFSQFILGAQNAGVDGVSVHLGEQEAVQVVKAAQQLDTELQIGLGLGAFSHKSVAEFGDFATQMAFVWSFPPATADLPVYEALRADLAASGDTALQPENLKTGPMKSWIGLYALLKMIRDAPTTTFTRAGIMTMLQEAKDVPMLGIFGSENWTPNLDHAGIFKRAGVNHAAVYRWDPTADSNGFDGNFVESSTFSVDEVLCGSALGAPAESC